ncbi:hypothetical protein EQZ20_02590 [Bacillus glycinifermentans]|uniref:Uncharacterized protein n=1 Tax=Bacillus glycinifermentans TaxID=1664069 RepID=A0AAJ3Z2G3_9BACI|nr:hypothetical protein TH62_14830 [Bacillus sp. TH008]QAT67742.1 hypothetical protein EQZ20_02590 [Bacillus glycinifermentans]
MVTLTALTMLTSGFGPVSSALAAEKTSQTVSTVQTSVPTSLLNYIESHKQPTSVQDTRAFIKFASQTKEFQAYNNTTKPGKMQTMGLIGGSLKAIKAFGWACRIGGKTLKWAIKPLSPSKAKLIDKYARKIAYATEKLNSASKGALVKALKKAGVPGKAAESIAEIILWLI